MEGAGGEEMEGAGGEEMEGAGIEEMEGAGGEEMEGTWTAGALKVSNASRTSLYGAAWAFRLCWIRPVHFGSGSTCDAHTITARSGREAVRCRQCVEVGWRCWRRRCGGRA